MQKIHIAYFISSHGYGHASRSAAIIESILAKNPNVRVSIYTETPCNFFEESLSEPFSYTKTQSDIGMIQLTPIEMDIPGTLKKLNAFIGSLPEESDRIASRLIAESVDFVVADISPLGILSAEKAGIPSLLLENFTWDWIYEPFAREYPGFTKVSRFLSNVFQSSTYHGQYAPACDPDASCDFILPPVSRRPRTDRDVTRQALSIRADQKLALISLGGVKATFNLPEQIDTGHNDIVFVFTGNFTEIQRHGNIIELPHHSGFYQPDLVLAADMLFGKAGYSTYAEIYNFQKPFSYLLRSDFRESAVLGEALEQLPSAFEIDALSFDHFQFDPWIEKMMTAPTHPISTNGSDIAADNILFFIRSGKPRHRSALKDVVESSH